MVSDVESIESFFIKLGRWLRRTNDLAGDLVAAVWLIGWFFICMGFIVITMAAQQFQTEISSSVEGNKLTVGQALNDLDQYTEASHSAQVAGRNRDLADSALTQAKAQVSDAELKAAHTRSLLKGNLSELYSRLGLVPIYNIGGKFEPQDFENSINFSNDLVFRATTYILKAPKSVTSDLKIQALLSTARGGVLTLQSQTDDLEAKVKKLSDFKEAQAVSYKNFDSAHQKLAGMGSMEQLANDMEYYKQLLYGFPFRFIALPSIVLTLFLTVLMGVLGALIALTRELVFEDHDHNFGQYLYRIGLGAAVALAVFFFAGAGALTLAQTSNGSAGSVQLSPYLVSFFAIVSGYLSRRVTQWMRETGGRIFQVQEESDRWAVDLDAALAQAGTTADALALATGLPMEELTLWKTRKGAVPYQAQLQISAFLRIPPYKLFSDIAPPP